MPEYTADSESVYRSSKPSQGNIFGVVDIGTTKITALIGRRENDGFLKVIGFGWQGSSGIKSGTVTDKEAAGRAVRLAVAQAEHMAEVSLKSVLVNLSGGAPESRLFNITWPIGGRKIESTDLSRIFQEVRNQASADNRSIIHTLPLGFTVDEMQGVRDPKGFYGDVLSSRLHVIDAATAAMRNLEGCINESDLELEGVISAPLAVGSAVLNEDEKELGVTVADMGGGLTSFGVFFEKHLIHTDFFPVGGRHITKDIADLLSTTTAHAERLKTLYGNVAESPDDEREMLSVPDISNEAEMITVPRKMLISVIRPRVEEIFELLQEKIKASGLENIACRRLVLTGGTSLLPGITESAGKILNCPHVRLGRVNNSLISSEISDLSSYTAALGMLIWQAGEGREINRLIFPPRKNRKFIDLWRLNDLLNATVEFIRERN